MRSFADFLDTADVNDINTKAKNINKSKKADQVLW